MLKDMECVEYAGTYKGQPVYFCSPVSRFEMEHCCLGLGYWFYLVVNVNNLADSTFHQRSEREFNDYFVPDPDLKKAEK